MNLVLCDCNALWTNWDWSPQECFWLMVFEASGKLGLTSSVYSPDEGSHEGEVALIFLFLFFNFRYVIEIKLEVSPPFSTTLSSPCLPCPLAFPALSCKPAPYCWFWNPQTHSCPADLPSQTPTLNSSPQIHLVHHQRTPCRPQCNLATHSTLYELNQTYGITVKKCVMKFRVHCVFVYCLNKLKKCLS